MSGGVVSASTAALPKRMVRGARRGHQRREKVRGPPGAVTWRFSGRYDGRTTASGLLRGPPLARVPLDFSQAAPAGADDGLLDRQPAAKTFETWSVPPFVDNCSPTCLSLGTTPSACSSTGFDCARLRPVGYDCRSLYDAKRLVESPSARCHITLINLAFHLRPFTGVGHPSRAPARDGWTEPAVPGC